MKPAISSWIGSCVRKGIVRVRRHDTMDLNFDVLACVVDVQPLPL